MYSGPWEPDLVFSRGADVAGATGMVIVAEALSVVVPEVGVPGPSGIEALRVLSTGSTCPNPRVHSLAELGTVPL